MPQPSALAVLTGLRAPSLEPWWRLEEPQAQPQSGAVRVIFLGVSTLLITDGETSILTDGFFSRPNLLQVKFGRVHPNMPRIRHALTRFGIQRLDALFVVHSHYDHALDSAHIAMRTGARLIGSESTRQIARGHAFPDDRFDVVQVGDPMKIGRFLLTALPAVHSPGDLAPGAISGSFDPRTKATDYLTGDCFTLHLRHGDQQLAVHASANMLEGALDGYRADTVYLGIGTLGKQTKEFRENYWRECVIGLGAKRVVPIHWDNFTVSLNKPLVPFPAFFDDFDESMRFLEAQAKIDGIGLALPTLGNLSDPFRDQPRS